VIATPSKPSARGAASSRSWRERRGLLGAERRVAGGRDHHHPHAASTAALNGSRSFCSWLLVAAMVTAVVGADRGAAEAESAWPSRRPRRPGGPARRGRRPWRPRPGRAEGAALDRLGRLRLGDVEAGARSTLTPSPRRNDLSAAPGPWPDPVAALTEVRRRDGGRSGLQPLHVAAPCRHHQQRRMPPRSRRTGASGRPPSASGIGPKAIRPPT